MWLYVSSYISFQHLSAQKPSFILLWWLFEGRIPIFGVQNPKKLPLKPSCIQICHGPHEPKVEPILHPPGRLSASVLPSSMALDRSSIASSSRPQDVGCWSMSQPMGMSPQQLERKQQVLWYNYLVKEFANLKAISGTLPLFQSGSTVMSEWGQYNSPRAT